RGALPGVRTQIPVYHQPGAGPERIPRGYGPMRVRQGPGYRRCGSATRPRGKDGRCMKPSSIAPGDHVIITRPERRGDKRSRVTTDGDGVVLAVYPRFV